MKHFEIRIRVTYEEDSVPEDMQSRLSQNVHNCVIRDNLLLDGEQGSVTVEQWHSQVYDLDVEPAV